MVASASTRTELPSQHTPPPGGAVLALGGDRVAQLRVGWCLLTALDDLRPFTGRETKFTSWSQSWPAGAISTSAARDGFSRRPWGLARACDATKVGAGCFRG